MRLGENIRALQDYVHTNGMRAALTRAVEVIRERLVHPWEIIYWLPAAAVARIELPAGARFQVIRALPELNAETRALLLEQLGAPTLSIWETRFSQGCEGHLLFLDERLAASRFVVWGNVTPFQNLVLTPHDTMGMDVRVDPALRGRGLAPIFFSVSIQDLARRGCERVFAMVAVHNMRSIKTLEHVGFRALLRCRIEHGRYRFEGNIIR
jgi:GNAT superfamily N-acetyltransferase